jgi:hypothetical protein
LAAVVTASHALPRIAWSSDYPVRPVQWIIGFPPGGGTDIVVSFLSYVHIGSLADICCVKWHVRFTPKSGRFARRSSFGVLRFQGLFR